MDHGTLGPDSYVLGVWDGHDSGAALLRGRQVRFAINEERLTRRKLEIRFPRRSIQACLEAEHLSPTFVHTIAYSTTDFAKTLTRLVPSLKEEYYRIRRRKEAPSALTALKKRVKYQTTRFFPSLLTRRLSDHLVRRELSAAGFSNFSLHCVDHHSAHAAGALFSGFSEALVLTLDGIGDGLSGSAFRLQEGSLERLLTLSGDNSLGIFYEHVTNLMNMRELEDEGKVMALANFAYPVSDQDNPMLRMIQVEGTEIRAARSTLAMYSDLQKVLWKFPAEQFCYMAQRTLELRVSELVRNLIQATGLRRLVLSGGVASNVKMNRILRNLAEVRDLFVFPHMGDGGQAIGAATAVAAQSESAGPWDFQDLLLGPEYADDDIRSSIQAAGLACESCESISDKTADILASGEIVFWFQGRMEIGPRALGNRSILALPGSRKLKDELNLKLKRRVWYQPFCPSLLEEDARALFDDFEKGSPDRYMTNAYLVREADRERLAGVLNVDGTCRPQIVRDEASLFGQLLRRVKNRTGLGALLNTSMNIHGEPLVCSPADALRAFKDSGARWMAIGKYLVRS